MGSAIGMQPIIAVTGAGGFIGRSFVREARAAGYEIRALAGPGDDPATTSGVTWVSGDITDADAVARCVEGASGVVHLAGSGSVAASFSDPAEYARVHLVGTSTVAVASGAAGVGRMVYVSSAEVYGPSSDSPVDERAERSPRSPYGVAKAAAEDMLCVLAPTVDLGVCVVRPFSVYGPGARTQSLMASLIGQAIESERIRLFDPEPVRDYVFVDDVAAALLRAAEHETAAGTVDVFNVGSGIGVSVRELASTGLVATGREGASVEWTGSDRPRAAAVRSLVADTTAAKRDLPWEAATPLAAGIATTIESLDRRS